MLHVVLFCKFVWLVNLLVGSSLLRLLLLRTTGPWTCLHSKTNPRKSWHRLNSSTMFSLNGKLLMKSEPINGFLTIPSWVVNEVIEHWMSKRPWVYKRKLKDPAILSAIQIVVATADLDETSPSLPNNRSLSVVWIWKWVAKTLTWCNESASPKFPISKLAFLW